MRERWFFAQGAERRGPFSFEELIEALRAEPDAGSLDVWRKGLGGWTPARTLLEIESRLASPPAVRSEPAREQGGPQKAPTLPPATRGRSWRRSLVVSAAAFLVVVASLWLRRSPDAGRAARAGPRPQAAPGTRSQDSPAAPPTRPDALLPEPAAATPVVGSLPASSGLADEEATLPSAQLRKLRGVAAWSEELLKLTVYNGTAWRVTELQLRVARLVGDELVEDEQPLTLLPPHERVEPGIADLLERVAPDRKRAGVNPLDTGVFEVRAGPAPRGFRWEIESARGYPPRR